MTLASDGPLLIVLDAAKRSLSATAAWSAIADANRIHYDALPAPDPGPDYTKAQLIALRPFALLWHDLSGGFRMQSATADLRCPIMGGKIICQIEVNTPSELAANPTALAGWVNRLVGQLLYTGDNGTPGLWDLANTPGYLPIRNIEVDAYIRSDKKELATVGDAIVFEFGISWGGD